MLEKIHGTKWDGLTEVLIKLHYDEFYSLPWLSYNNNNSNSDGMNLVMTDGYVVHPQEIISANTVLISNLHRVSSFGELFLYRRIILQWS